MARILTSPVATGAPGIPPRWTRSAKDAVCTAYSSASRLWFTTSAGVLNEIYFPTIDQPQVRDLQFLITDGETFFHEERRHLHSDTEYLDDHGSRRANRQPFARRPLSDLQGSHHRSASAHAADQHPPRGRPGAAQETPSLRPARAASVRRRMGQQRLPDQDRRPRVPDRQQERRLAGSGSHDAVSQDFMRIRRKYRRMAGPPRQLQDGLSIRRRARRQHRAHRRDRFAQGLRLHARPRLRPRAQSRRDHAVSVARRPFPRASRPLPRAMGSRVPPYPSAREIFRRRRRALSPRAASCCSRTRTRPIPARSSLRSASRGARPRATRTWAAIIWSGPATWSTA